MTMKEEFLPPSQLTLLDVSLTEGKVKHRPAWILMYFKRIMNQTFSV